MQNLAKKVLMIGLLVVSTFAAQAALPPKSVILQKSGVATGGDAGVGFTLSDLRLSRDLKKKIERIVIDVSDINGEILKTLPGYYHVELKDKSKQLVLNMSQTPHTKILESKIQQTLKSSLYVKNSTMSLDPVDNTLTLALDLKQEVRARVFAVPGGKQTSKIVIDLF